jgi:hypothetical protein
MGSIVLVMNEKYRNLYICNVDMSEEPIFSYTFLGDPEAKN